MGQAGNTKSWEEIEAERANMTDAEKLAEAQKDFAVEPEAVTEPEVTPETTSVE